MEMPSKIDLWFIKQKYNCLFTDHVHFLNNFYFDCPVTNFTTLTQNSTLVSYLRVPER